MKSVTKSSTYQRLAWLLIALLAIPHAGFQPAARMSNEIRTVVIDAGHGGKDPGNLGTILRTLDWFGFREVICSLDTVDFTNPKVIQSSMGSIFRVGLSYADLKEVFEQNSGILPIIGTAMEGENAFNCDLKSGLLIIGNEAEGIRLETKKWVDKWISIPQAGNKVESLNASIATAILCAERFKRLE
jgi:TrmH family RNA methyltransferase